MTCNLKKLLISESKHGNYQMLAPALINLDPTLSVFSNTRRLDSQRYDWFSSKLDFEGKKVLDIGANIGYFDFRLATEKNVKITTYEPCKEHSEIIDVCKSALGLKDEVFINISKGVSLSKVKKLEKQDIIIMFNVLQHAGEDFDETLIKDISEWRNYAISYLNELREVTEYLIFQMGFTWLGHSGKLCEDDEILDFSIKLLIESGWAIKYCGIIKDIKTPYYVDYNINKAMNIHPLSNKKNKIKFKIINKFLHNKYDYRFMQRPLYICKVKSDEIL